jgi:FkbM family methyltransferase
MHADLIYDVGASRGIDTEHYLAQGFRVVAIDADPKHVDMLNERFRPEIRAGRCTVVQAAIADEDGEAPFYLVPERPVWNSFDKGMATREGLKVEEIRVRCRRFDGLLREHGVPHFLKVDIEGYDDRCINALAQPDLPDFVSFEAEANYTPCILKLYELGYRQFALIDQANFRSVRPPDIGTTRHVKWAAKQRARRFVRAHPGIQRTIDRFRPRINFAHQPVAGHSVGGSGPTPMERKDGWLTIDEFLYTWTTALKCGWIATATEAGMSWYDVHARR